MDERKTSPPPCAWFPVELYRNIIRFVRPPNDLSNLCRVSRMFRDEAQPILYDSSELLCDDYDRILAWSRVIDSRPHLARMVHILTIPYEISISSNVLWARAKLHTAFASALRKTFNLKGINVIEYPETTSPGTSRRIFTLLPKMMMGCGFKLHAFCGRLSTGAFLADWWKFFREQKEIRYWDPVPRVPGHGMILPLDMFPQLNAIVLRQTEPTSNTNLLLHLGSRPIQRFSLQWEMSKGNPLHVIRWSVVLTSTITHFNWEELGPTSLGGRPTPIEIILAIIEQLPRLEFLRFSSAETAPVSYQDLINAVSRLENIETVMLDVVLTNISGEHNSSKGNLELAEAFMASCPTLRQFSFGVPGSSDNCSESGRRRVYPCYTRELAGGKVQLGGFGIIDKDSWRDGV